MKSASSLAAAVLLLLSVSTVKASMNDQVILGQALDGRVTQCGVAISGGAMATLRPFIKASASLAGTVRVRFEKSSASGASTMAQSSRFSGGSLGGQLAVDRPAQVKLTMTVEDMSGQPLCRLDEDFSL